MSASVYYIIKNPIIIHINPKNEIPLKIDKFYSIFGIPDETESIFLTTLNHRRQSTGPFIDYFIPHLFG